MIKKIKIIIIVLLFCQLSNAQELYVFTEPASNMPAHSLSAKLGYRLPHSKLNNNYKQRFMPELMLGLNKSWMMHIGGSFSNFYSKQLRWESVKAYAKWRFFSKDQVHRHFRMAAFAEGAYTHNPLIYDEINLDGDNDGIQAGVIATQLLHKLAISATGSVTKVFVKKSELLHANEHSLKAFNYSFSAGYLIYPNEYTSYEQTNINIYTEFLGMKGIKWPHYMLDIAPAIQVIFNSNFKLNVGARFQLAGNMTRLADKNYYIGIERTFLGVLNARKKKNR